MPKFLDHNRQLTFQAWQRGLKGQGHHRSQQFKKKLKPQQAAAFGQGLSLYHSNNKWFKVLLKLVV